MLFTDRRQQLLDDIVREVKEAGLRIVEARVDRQAMGSLYIEVERHIVLAWDSRDHVASIGNATPGVNRLLWSSEPTWDAHLLASRLVELAKADST